MQETQVQSLGQEDPLEKEMALQYSCLGNPMNRKASSATLHGVASDLDMTEQLSTHKRS